MFETFITKMTTLFAAIPNPFSTATWFVLGVLMFFIWLFSKAHKNPNSDVDWEDLILEYESFQSVPRVSPYKLGYLIGVIVSTWIVIRFADAGNLGWDILGGYLAFLLGGAGVAATMRSRENTASINANVPPPGFNDGD